MKRQTDNNPYHDLCFQKWTKGQMSKKVGELALMIFVKILSAVLTVKCQNTCLHYEDSGRRNISCTSKITGSWQKYAHSRPYS